MSFALINKLTAEPGQRQRVVEILLASGKLFDDNPACHLYLVSESAEEPDVIWVVDLWSSEDEHSAAVKNPDLQPFVEESLPLLEGMPEQILVNAVGGKGLPD